MAQEVIEITEREIEIIEVIERGPVGQTGPQPDINYEVISSARTLEAADLIAADTSGGAFTLTLPANPSNGDAVDIFDFSETFDTNPLTIARNGSRIESLEENLVCNVEGAYFTLIYTGATRGWQVLPRYGTSGGGGESALTTEGDMLYRGPAVNTRLPIGTAGQILKVNSGATAPEWGEAPATGVTSVSGTAPIASSGGATPTISITAATTSAAGSMSSADKTKLDAITGTNTGDQTITLTGNVTGSGTGSFATTIANDAVDNTKLSNMAQSTLKGRATASTGDPEDLSASQVRTILNVADGAEVNVQSNWTEADSGSDAFILNKPTLGGAASLDVGTAAGTVAAGDDARLSDSRDPNTHAASHASAGSDPLAPSSIGAQSLFASGSITGASSPSAARAIIYDVANFGSAYDINLPITNSLQGDIFVFRTVNLMAANVTIKYQVPPSSPQTVATLTAVDQQLRFIYRANAQQWDLVPVDTHTHPASAISDSTTAGRALLTGADSSAQRTSLGLGTAATSATGDFAAASHSHGNINSSGQVGSVSGLPLVTTTAGAVTTLALGTAGQVLTVNSGANGVEFAAAAGGGVTAVGTSTADVLSVSGSDLVADDGGLIDSSDPFIKWDDAAGKLVYANPLSRPSGAMYVGLAPSTTALGSNAINIQATRSGATNIASGNTSICIGAGGNTASGQESISIGVGNAVSALRATAVGYANTASGQESVSLGSLGFASGVKSVGVNETAVLRGQVSLLPFRAVYWGGQTTNDAATVLNLDATATNRFTIASNSALAVDILLVARRSDTQDKWLVARRFLGIRRDGSNNTSLIGSVQTLGTDQSAGSPTWSFTLTADDTNEALQLEVTGAASETVQWRATAFYRVV